MLQVKVFIISVSNSIKILGNTYYLMNNKTRYFTAYFWWGIAKTLYFMGLDFENLYGRNTIGFTVYYGIKKRPSINSRGRRRRGDNFRN
jgi:hypothetical protein